MAVHERRIGLRGMGRWIEKCMGITKPRQWLSFVGHSIGQIVGLASKTPGSFVWNFGPILELASICIDVDFDMCEYGLLPFHLTESDSVFIKKPTRLRTNLNALSALSCKCSGTHKHFACMGHVRVGGKSVRVSTAAGIYPPRLCQRWAKLVAAAVAPA